MNKTQEALNRLNTIVESQGYKTAYAQYLNSFKVAAKDIDTLQEGINKLARYEALEQELGIDLVKLFNAKDIYYRIKYIDTNEYSEIEKADRFYINPLNRELRVFSSEYDEYGFGLPLKDYGETWWINRPEELQDEL